MKDFDIEILQQMASRFNPLPTNDPFLDSRYEWQKNDNHQEWPYYRFFYHLAKWLEPGIVLELGGYQGTAAAHFAAGWKEGAVITIDHHTDPGDEINHERMMDCYTWYNNIVYLQGWTTPELASINKGMHKLGDALSVYEDVANYTLYRKKKIDILFIDSWHRYEYARGDWLLYKPLLSDNALVICDDIIDGEGENDPISGMMRFWDEMPEPKFLNSNLHPTSNMGFVKI